MKIHAAEAIGTFALVFAGTGAVVVDERTGGQVTHVGVALTFGLVVMAMIYAVGDISGAHLNPAVTLGFWFARRLPGRAVAAYILSQVSGALVASASLRAMFGAGDLGATLPAGSVWQSFFLELLLTALLMFVILRVSSGPKEKGLLAGVAVGGVIAFEALFGGPISGASMNPARSLAPAIVGGSIKDLWVYLTAPPLGALLAVVAFYCVGSADERNAAGSDFAKSSVRSANQGGSMQRVVFVCIENSNRSQMAEAFARMLGGVEAFSAGSRPSGQVSPKAIAAMNELGYDLSTHHSKSLADLPDLPFDVAVTMGCGDACPNLKAMRREDWKIPNPNELSPEQFRTIRDLIAGKVNKLIFDLRKSDCGHSQCPSIPANEMA
ncbi:MAG TPA: aquaporin [Pirellulales bacterium]|nr:aquaporin [Pirellulales bacterium]